MLLVVSAFFVLFLTGLAVKAMISRNLHPWVWRYAIRALRGTWRRKPVGLVHVLFCMVDHYEPKWQGAGAEVARRRVETWCREYPRLAERHRDGDGKPPQHSWFYPAEEYEPQYLQMLTELCRQGYGELELHLHHDNDTSEGLRQTLAKAIGDFRHHGWMEAAGAPSQVAYGFIHGNWALDNSHPNGSWCGVNDELTILRETGCYADFTLPSAPSPCQTSTVNTIYYAVDNPTLPKSHDRGREVEAGRGRSSDLLLVQGPLCLNWRRRKWWILPRIENGEISASNPASVERFALWLRQWIHVKGREEWVVVKVHCHGAQERDWPALLGREAGAFYKQLECQYNDGQHYKLHYVTARELFNIIQAAADGKGGDPNQYRDYLVPPYRALAKVASQ